MGPHRDRGRIQGTEGPACRDGVGKSPIATQEAGGSAEKRRHAFGKEERDTGGHEGERAGETGRETSVGGTRENMGTQTEPQCTTG